MNKHVDVTQTVGRTTCRTEKSCFDHCYPHLKGTFRSPRCTAGQVAKTVLILWTALSSPSHSKCTCVVRLKVPPPLPCLDICVCPSLPRSAKVNYHYHLSIIDVNKRPPRRRTIRSRPLRWGRRPAACLLFVVTTNKLEHLFSFPVPARRDGPGGGTTVFSRGVIRQKRCTFKCSSAATAASH